MKAVLGITAAAAVLMMAGSAAAQDKNKDKAMQIFVAQKCTQCHSIAGKGSKKGVLDDVGKKLTAAQIREWLVDPVGAAAKTTPPPTRKPPMKKKAIPEDEIDVLVGYLATLKG
jgi:mono/diheme cytochrome c family protein